MAIFNTILFSHVDMIVCEIKDKYHKEHPEEKFEFEHIKPTEAEEITKSPHNMTKVRFLHQPPQVKLQQRIEKFIFHHCMKSRTCSSHGHSVCGIDKEEKNIAEFPNKCIFHAVNCVKQGRYKIIKNNCKPNIIFDTEQIISDNGQRSDYYMTFLPTTTAKTAFGEPTLIKQNQTTINTINN